MTIKGEVHVKSMVWSSKISLNDGRYVIRPFECKIVGKLARVQASITPFLLSLRTKNGELSPCLSTTSTAKPNTQIFLLPVMALSRDSNTPKQPKQNTRTTNTASEHPNSTPPASEERVFFFPSRRCSEAVSSLASGPRADSLPWFDSPLVQGASRLRYTDKAQMQRPGHTGRKVLATKNVFFFSRGVREEERVANVGPQ